MKKNYSLAVTILLLLLSNLLVAQQQLNKTLVHDGNTRDYTVYIPASYDGSIAVPLIFSFHGGAGNIASQIAIADMRPIADTAGCILVYPQAIGDPNSGNATSWTHKAPTTHDDVFFVEAMIDDLSSEYMVDANRVYACGYSNGGEFTFELACRLGSKIAAIGVVARSMFIDTYNECSPSHPTAVVSIHGTNDDYNGIVWLGTTYYVSLDTVNSYWSDYNNTNTVPVITTLPNINTSDGSTVEHHSWSNGDGCVAVEHFKVLNGGHDWPGSFGNMDIDATEEIWNFVSKYDRSGLIDCSTTSVDDITNEQNISIYPNPSGDIITVEMDWTANASYQIYSSVGELKLSGVINTDNNIDLTSLPSGIYFLKVENKIRRFVKTK